MPKQSGSATRVRGVYHHKSGGYLARLRTRGISVSRKFSSLNNAERWITQAKIDLERGDAVLVDGQILSKEEAAARRVASQGRTVERLIDRFIATGECRIKPAHVSAIRSSLGLLQVADLARADCIEFLEKAARGRKPATYNRWRAALHRLMNYAVEV